VLEASSFAVAFGGGVLALLAPCSALLLPAFFAYAFASRTGLVKGTLLFLLGLCTVLLPLGLAASIAGRLLIEQRQTTILVAGAVLIALGVWEMLGRGLQLVPMGWLEGLQKPTQGPATYATGVVYGLTGFCSGPLLGGVLTVAAAGQNPPLGAALLLVYALGMVAPLFLLATAWDRYDLGRRRWLHGRAIRVGRLWLHTTNLLAGGLFILLGASFIASQGGALWSGAYDDLGLSTLGFRLQAWLDGAL
jgi:cytochrome c biogenesis protein CcdA